MPTIDSSSTSRVRHADTASADTASADASPPDAIGPTDEGNLRGGKVDGGSASERVAVRLEDDEVMSGRGNNARRSGTMNASGGDSGRLGLPSEQLSSSNSPREHDL
jgi:hypothetical protein